MSKITIKGDYGRGGSGLHTASGGDDLASAFVAICKFLRDNFDGPARFAQGQLTCVAKASLVDGDNFTLPTGHQFWFDVGGAYTPAGGYDATNVRLNVSGATTAESVAAIIKTAINASASTTKAITTDGAGKLLLAETVGGSAKNGAIVEAVANAGFLVQGMWGGLDANAFSAVITIPAYLG